MRISDWSSYVCSSDLPIWGMNSSERLRRSLARAGIGLVDAPEAAGAGDWLLMRADWVYDEALVGALAKSPDTLLIGGNGEVVAAHVGGAEAQPVAALLKRSGDRKSTRLNSSH